MSTQYIVKLNTKQAPEHMYTVVAGRELDDPKYIQSFNDPQEAEAAYKQNSTWPVCVLEVVVLPCPTADMLTRFDDGDSVNHIELLMLLGYYRSIREALTLATSTPPEYHLVWKDVLLKYNKLHDYAASRKLQYKFE